MSDLVDTRLSTVEELHRALLATDAQVSAIQDRVTKSVARVERTVAEARAAARQAVDRAEAELRVCRQQRDADCSALEAALRQARNRLERAERALRLVDRASIQCNAAKSRFSREMLDASRVGQGILSGVAADLGGYLGASSGAGAVGGGGGAEIAPSSGGSSTGGSPVGWGALPAIAGAPGGFVKVPLALINTSESTVTGPESFGKGYSPEDLAWGYRALHEVVIPAMAAGHGLDYLLDRDQAEGRKGTRSYEATYLGFFGDPDAIRLDVHADGSATVGNGFHRIWIAQQAGLTWVPARVHA